MLRRDLGGRDADLHMELCEVGLIRTQRAVGEIPDGLTVLEKFGNRLLHVHRCRYAFTLFWGSVDPPEVYVGVAESQELFG